MKKRYIIFAFLLLILIMPFKVEAKTLKDFRDELAALKQKKADQDAGKKLKEQEMAEVKQKIENTTNTITEHEATIKTLTKEIDTLNEQAKERELEIKEVLHFLQIANGESAYLEYIFGAKDITDFIYRSAVSGQLVEYNDELIDEYNATIKKNEQKQEDLKVELVNLDKAQKEFQANLAKLGKELNAMLDVSLSIDEDIKAAEKNIKRYEDLGCKENQDITDCTSVVPYSNSFVRPLISGRITSGYGMRWGRMHNGVDIAGGDTRVYAAAPGTVAAIHMYQSCGGNMIFLNHNIGGHYYTTAYFHTKNIRVKVGDYVDQNTILATMGGDPSTWGYDKCSTGQHLHFAVATGLYMKEYFSWNDYIAHNLNPVTVVNFPAAGVWFSNRITKY